MAEKDAMERTLEDHNDVFSDILNVLVYRGKQEIEPEALENVTARSVYKADGILRDQERDIAKYWKNNQVSRCPVRGRESDGGGARYAAAHHRI